MHHNNNRKKRNRRSGNDSHGSTGSTSSASSSSDGEDHSCHPRSSRGNYHHDHKNNANNNNNKCRRNNNKRRSQTRKREKRQQPLPAESQFVALDCEMVGIGEGGHNSSIARITLIDWDGNVLLDEYIRQCHEVTDYRTFVSGITKEDLQEKATLYLEECRKEVLQLLQNHILVGHALKNDLKALDVSHPWWLTRDTAKFEPFMKIRFDDGVLWPRKLKELASEKLHQEIQLEGQPHSPYEDALAALDLYKTVRSKWESVMAYKIGKTNQIRLQHQQPLLTQ